MTTSHSFNVRQEVNPHFYEVWNTQKPYNILKGGRGSFKSSVIQMLLVRLIISYIQAGETANVIVIRKTANTLRDSVFKGIQWALEKFGLLDQFKLTVAPFTIRHEATGSTFYFYGQSDFERLKSNEVGNVIAVWYEEASEFLSKEEFDQTNTTFMRQQHKLASKVYFFWSYNPPRNPYSWINEWATDLQNEPNYLVHTSSYLNDELGFITYQMLEEINRIKRNDPDYYRYLYLGEPVGLGTNVYNMDLIHIIDELPDDEVIVEISYSADTGHQTSATSVGMFGVTNKNNVVLIDQYYYEPAGKVRKKAPSELAYEVNEFIRSKEYLLYDLTIDSAEGAFRNQYFLDYGERWIPVKKKKKFEMIDYTHDLLAQGRFYVVKNDNNQIFIDQMRQYQWDEKTVQTENPQPVKENDHSVDMFQYYVMNHTRRLGLRH